MSKASRYREAVANAEASKAQLMASVEAAKTRAAPSRLMADAKAKVINSILEIPTYAVTKIRQRPVATGAAVAALVVYLNRRPVRALFERLYVRWKNRNLESDDG